MNIHTNIQKSQELQNEVEMFLACGGQVQELPRGFSGALAKGWNNADQNKNAQARMKAIMSASVERARSEKKTSAPAISGYESKRGRPHAVEHPNRVKAIANGENRFIGNPCSKCGGVERYVYRSRCVACVLAVSAELNQKKREGRKEAPKQYIGDKEKKLLSDWIEEKYGRQQKLADVFGVKQSIFYKYKTGERPCLMSRFEEIREAMRVVEKQESEQQQKLAKIAKKYAGESA